MRDPGRLALDAVQAQWNAAARRWDADALTLLYTEDAMFHGGRPGHSVGRESIRTYFASYRGIIESGQLKLQDQHIVAVAPGVFLAQGEGDFSFVLAPGRPTRSTVRTSLALVQRGGWKILLHHFSPSPPRPPLGDD